MTKNKKVRKNAKKQRSNKTVLDYDLFTERDLRDLQRYTISQIWKDDDDKDYEELANMPKLK